MAAWDEQFDESVDKFVLGCESSFALWPTQCRAFHPEDKKVDKYRSWSSALFRVSDGEVYLKQPVFFWACLWGPERDSIWSDYGLTKLAFEEYLLIGIASDLFPCDLLNREGRNR